MRTRTLSIALCVVPGIFNACTASSPVQSTPSSTMSASTEASSQMRASDRMFYWREEARELHAMAKHREREAELVLKRKPGPATNEVAKHMRSLAQQLDATAQYADAQAREAEREVPPDIVH